MNQLPQTPSTQIQMPLDDAAARAVERLAQAAEQLKQTANTSGLQKQGQTLRDVAFNIVAAQVAMRALSTGARDYARLGKRQADIAKLNNRLLKDANRAAPVRATVARRVQQQQVRADAAAPRTEREIGAALSKRSRTLKTIHEDSKRIAAVEGGALRKTVAHEARGEKLKDFPRGGDAGAIYSAAGSERRHLSAMQSQENYQQALDAVARRRMLNDKGHQGAKLFYAEEHSGWENASQQAQTRSAEARERSRMELGGVGYGDKGKAANQSKEKVQELRKRQSEAYYETARADLTEEVQDAQRVLAMRKRIAAYERSPEGKALLAARAGLHERIERSVLKQEAAEARIRAGLASTQAGQKDALDRARTEAALAADNASSELARRRAALAFGETAEGQQAGQKSQEQQGQGSNLALEEQVRLLKERERFYNSPAGVQAAKEEVKQSKELERQKRRARFAEIKAKHGGGAVGTIAASWDYGTERVRDWEKKIEAMGDAGQRAFATIAAGAAGLTSVGDPFVAWPTFTGSVQALGIALSEMVLPVMNELSAKLQGAASWIRSLSDHTKLWGTRLLIWVAAGGLAVSVIWKTVVAVRALMVAVGGLNAVLVTGGIMLVVAAIAALSAEYAILGDKATDAAKAMGEVAGIENGRAKKSESGITNEEMGKLPAEVQARIRAAGTDRNEMLAALLEFQERARVELERARPAQLGGLGEAQRRDATLRRIEPEGLQREAERMGQSRQHQGNLDRLAARQSTWAGRAEMILRGGFGQRDLPQANDATAALEYESTRYREDMLRTTNELTRASVELARRQGVTTFRESDINPDVRRAETAARRSRGEVSEEEIRARVTSVLGGFRGASTPATTRVTQAANAEFLRLEQRKKLADDLVKKTGADTLMNQKWPVAPSIGDPMSYLDKIQIQALQGDDLDKDNTLKQLELAERSAQHLAAIRGLMERRPPGPFDPPPGGPQRAKQ